MSALVAQLKAKWVTVVVRADVAVAVQNRVPVALFSRTFALGNTVPTLAVFLIQRLNVRVEPFGTTPAALGMPA
jgi:hypothetical protein